MFVCLCTGTTSHAVTEAVAGGARTSRDIQEACGAGGDCGRCRRNLRSIIESHFASVAIAAPSARAAEVGPGLDVPALR